MKTIVRRKLAAEKAKILQRLDDAVEASGANPMLAASNIPAQIIRSGRRIIYRLLAWNRFEHILFRFLDAH